MFASATTSTRLAKPSHELWKPLPYMTRGVQFLTGQDVAAIWLDPGMRKTSITLAAFTQLKAQGVAYRMLVIAPLRVCRLVWRQEAAKWTQFKHLRFSLLHGPKKAEALRADADVYLINPEGVQWLAQQFFGRPLPFDTLCIDEITTFKNHQSERSKALRPRLKGCKRRWGLTGTPNPNGYMDLFGQFLMLDDGAALGRYITHYRDLYFQPDFNGFDYVLQPGGAARIEDKIRPYVFSLNDDEYLDLPPFVDDFRMVEMSSSARASYKKMKNDMLAHLPGGVVTAANSAAVYSKLAQMANGAVYLEEAGGPRKVEKIHDAKLDALGELIDELDGKQLLIAYEFQHDIDRIKERFPHVQVLGNGTSAAQEEQIERLWNAGEVPLLAAHPASIGHGLNLQGSSACHICWFSPTWNLEHYDQFNRRLRRSGTKAARVLLHLLLMKDSIDDTLKLPTLRDKDATQQGLRARLNMVLQDGDGGGAVPAFTKETTMGMKLSRQSAAADDEDEAPRKIVPKGWGGKPATDEPEEAEEEAEDDVPAQKQAIRAKIAPKQPEPESEEDEETEEAPKAKFAQAVKAKVAPAEETEEVPAPKKAAKPKQIDLEEAIAAAPPAPSQSWERMIDFHVPVPASKYPAVLAAIAKVLGA